MDDRFLLLIILVASAPLFIGMFFGVSWPLRTLIALDKSALFNECISRDLFLSHSGIRLVTAGCSVSPPWRDLFICKFLENQFASGIPTGSLSRGIYLALQKHSVLNSCWFVMNWIIQQLTDKSWSVGSMTATRSLMSSCGALPRSCHFLFVQQNILFIRTIRNFAN